MSGRLDKTPDEVVRRLLIDPSLDESLKHNFYDYLDVNSAHTLSLLEGGLISQFTGATLEEATRDMRRAGPEGLPRHSSLEDLYFTIEADMIRRVGPEIGGRLHTGRSRNDILSTVSRMRVREETLRITKDLIRLKETLLELASRHRGTVVSGYTHMQPAEPISVGHFLVALAYALDRNLVWLLRSFEDMNLSPLGAGAMASTTFSIDRERTAGLLGFAGVMENSLDAIASRDYIFDLLSVCTATASNLSRFAQELHLWCSYEFGYAEVASSIAVTSSIMPQKKNPVTLEHVKAKVAHAEAAWISAVTVLKSAPYSHSREVAAEPLRLVFDGVKETRDGIELFEHTIKNITFNTQRMEVAAAENFSCVTELANVLVRTYGVPFRTAHYVVGQIVNECIDKGLRADQITADLVRRTAASFELDLPNLSEELVARVLDPRKNIDAKVTRGGPAPREVQRQIDDLCGRVDQHKQLWDQSRARIDLARASLAESREMLLGSSPGH